LLLIEKLAKSGFLVVAAFEDEGDARGELGVGNGAAIELGASETMDVAAESHAICVIDGLRDARGDTRRLRKLRGVALRLRGCAQRWERE
jgi:hypothetical protein